MKRAVDIVFSFAALVAFSPVMLLTAVLIKLTSPGPVIYAQPRVGLNGRIFKVYKFRTMAKNSREIVSTVTTRIDPRITPLGHILRRLKIDELPQLVNVLLKDMSFVGPRPDVPGFADKLEGDDRIILTVRPGITGPATLKYRDEEKILAGKEDPEKYNMEVIFPDKVRINREYVKNHSFWRDMEYIIKTIIR